MARQNKQIWYQTHSLPGLLKDRLAYRGADSMRQKRVKYEMRDDFSIPGRKKSFPNSPAIRHPPRSEVESRERGNKGMKEGEKNMQM
jgi:hypothetical protein